MSKPKTSLFSTLQKTADVSSSVNSEIVRQLPLSKLLNNPLNQFSMDEDEDFIRSMHSIEEDGLFEDLIVTPAEDGNYRIISGHRRAAIARKLGKTSVPCKVRTYKNELEEARALIGANIHKRSISPLDMARQLRVLSEVLDRQVGTAGSKERVQQLSDQTGLSLRTVERYLSLLNLNPVISEAVAKGAIPMSDAYDLALKKNEDLQKTIASEMSEIAQDIPLHDKYVQALQAAQSSPRPEKEKKPSASSAPKMPSKVISKYGKMTKKMAAELATITRNPEEDPSLDEKLSELESGLEELLSACRRLHSN